jgi:predicted XRE-type DNA-binding protein
VTKKRFASVWDAIEDTPEKAENMKLRSSLMIDLKEHIADSGLSQW